MNVVRRLGIVLLYLLIACIALNALVANFNIAMPGVAKLKPNDTIQPSEFDIFYWNLWWVKHAVFDLHVSPLVTNYVIYPFTSPLAGHTLALAWGLITAPLQDLIGLTPTFNLVMVLAFVLAATGMYAFARRHVKSQSVAVLAGMIFAFTPAMLHRASLGHLDKLSIFWLPLVLLLWDKAIETRRWTWALITGLAVWFAWLTDFQQAMWALLLLGPYVIYTVVVTGKRRKLQASVSLWLVAVALVAFSVPSLFAPLPQLLAANQLNYPPARLEDTAYFAFPVQNLLTGSDNGDFSIGLLLPLLTLVAVPFIRRDGRRWLWVIIALGGLLFALGPYVEVNGTRLELPYALVHRLLGNQYRTPMRFMTPAVLALTMLIALTLDQLSERFKWDSVRRRALIVTLGFLFLFDYRLAEPFPITIMPDYQTYHDIGAAPGDFAVLEIPIGVRSGFAVVGRGEVLQYYAPVHQRPIPSGYLSRLPGEITDTFYFDPVLGALTLSQALPPQAELDAQLGQLIRSWNIGYVILHTDLLEAGRVRSFQRFLDRQPALERVGDEGALIVYKARSP